MGSIASSVLLTLASLQSGELCGGGRMTGIDA